MTAKRVGQGDEDWAMPFGDSIYTHALEPKALTTGTAYQRYFKPGKGKPKKMRKVGFRPPKTR